LKETLEGMWWNGRHNGLKILEPENLFCVSFQIQGKKYLILSQTQNV